MSEKETQKDEKETKKKSEALYSEDVAELVDIYIQMDGMFEDAKPKAKPTSEDIEKLATTVFIKRQRDAKPERSEATSKPASTSKTMDCPQCGKVLQAKTSKTGKSYYSCGDCHGFANKDGSFTPWSKQ